MIIEDFKQIISSSNNWTSFFAKTILITGANGSLASYMVDFLLLLNKKLFKDGSCKVIALVKNQHHTKHRFREHLDDINLKIIVQDVVEEILINDKIDFIVHAASLASPKYYSNPVDVILPNIIGTKNTLKLAIKNNVEGYLYFSSGEVYGQPPNNEKITENSYGYLDPTAVRSCYGESKRMGENLCISYGHQFDIPVKIVRPFHTYGPGVKLDDGRVYADFIKNIVQNKNIEIKSDGTSIRSFCYLADATSAFFKVLLEGKNSNAYNVANPRCAIMIKELATTLVRLYPKKKLTVTFTKHNKSYLESPVNKHIIDITKLTSLDWKPKTSIIDGFKKTIRSYE